MTFAVRDDQTQRMRILKVGLHVTGLVAIVALAFYFIDVGVVRARIEMLSWATLTSMVVLHVGIILFVSYRFALIVRAVGANIQFRDALDLTAWATLANLLLPTSLAGDAGRVWLVRKFQIETKVAIAAGLYDRAIGLGSLGLIVAAGALLAPTIVPLWLVAIMCLLTIGLVLLARMKFASKYQSLHKAAKWAVLLSVAAHLVSVAIAKVFTTDTEVLISLGDLLVLFPAVLLAASIPVSIGGWGVRELTAAGVFATVGMDAASAVALAFMFGLTQVMAAGLSCGVLLLLRALRRRPA